MLGFQGFITGKDGSHHLTRGLTNGKAAMAITCNADTGALESIMLAQAGCPQSVNPQLGPQMPSFMNNSIMNGITGPGMLGAPPCNGGIGMSIAGMAMSALGKYLGCTSPLQTSPILPQNCFGMNSLNTGFNPPMNMNTPFGGQCAGYNNSAFGGMDMSGIPPLQGIVDRMINGIAGCNIAG